MKKIISIILSLIIVGALSGCSAENDKVSPSMNETTTTAAATSTTTAATTAPAPATTASAITTETTTDKAITTLEEPITTTKAIEPTTSNKVLLDVKNISRFPELPLGGTVVAPIIALNYYGFNCDKTELLKYVKIMKNDDHGYWGDPNKMFIGDPTGYNLAYGSSSVIKKALKEYWKANNVSGYKVVDLGDSDFSKLFSEIDAGNPVIIWVGGSMMDMEGSFISLNLLDGGTFDYSPSADCVCLIGYDKDNETVFTCDSTYNTETYIEYSKALVENVYNQMGKQALVIHKK